MSLSTDTVSVDEMRRIHRHRCDHSEALCDPELYILNNRVELERGEVYLSVSQLTQSVCVQEDLILLS